MKSAPRSLFGTPRIAAGAHDWSGDFARALEANPALLGWRSVETDQLQCTARIEGRLPAELQGTFYRNGPAVHERFGLRYRHLFDGDGMVQAFRFDGLGVSHRARVLGTPKLVRETEAGRRLTANPTITCGTSPRPFFDFPRFRTAR